MLIMLSIDVSKNKDGIKLVTQISAERHKGDKETIYYDI